MMTFDKEQAKRMRDNAKRVLDSTREDQDTADFRGMTGASYLVRLTRKGRRTTAQVQLVGGTCGWMNYPVKAARMMIATGQGLLITEEEE
jgi:hypothetical protein